MTLKFAPLPLVPMDVPPDGTVYHVIVPAPVAFRLVLLPQAMVDGLAVTGLGAAVGFTVTVTAVLAEGVQPPFVASA